MKYWQGRPGVRPSIRAIDPESCHPDAWRIDTPAQGAEMFGDAMFEDDDEVPALTPDHPRAEEPLFEEDDDELMAFGGLDERVRRLAAMAQLLREVGGR